MDKNENTIASICLNETPPYNETNIDTLLCWWKTCGDGTKHNPGVLSTLAVKLLSFFDFKCKTRIAILWCRLTEEESLGVFQEAALVAEINDDLEEFDSNSEENEENDDNDTDSNNEYDEFDEDEFGAVFLQSLQNE
ncbi:21693_t:CDS:2 [Entrophospora sp. SA101]|nr:21693_t:CDS:2 [Entrophospora sp. SA101]